MGKIPDIFCLIHLLITDHLHSIAFVKKTILVCDLSGRVVRDFVTQLLFSETLIRAKALQSRQCCLPLVTNEDVAFTEAQEIDVAHHLFVSTGFPVESFIWMLENSKCEVRTDMAVEHRTPQPHLVALRATVFREYVGLPLVEVGLVRDENASLPCMLEVKPVGACKLFKNE